MSIVIFINETNLKFRNISAHTKNFDSRKFAPKCHGCGEAIAPKIGETSAQILNALGTKWHPRCFKCKVILTVD